mmetsp:Transcript_14690/g.14311  ORF Transcript_14690/g.14311 Transcript_14690/m.14311 type:complete len:264 (-) Transcript_14690:390-1181(-)
MAIPPSKDEHRVLIDASSVSEAIQWGGAISLHLSPLIGSRLQIAFMEIAKAGLSIIASEDIQRAIIEDHGVVSSLRRVFSNEANIFPFPSSKVEGEEVLVEVSGLLLVASKEVQAILVDDSFGSRPGQGRVSLSGQLLPPVFVDIIAVKVIFPVIIICAPEQEDLVVVVDALVAGPRRVAHSLRLQLHPLPDDQVVEVLRVVVVVLLFLLFHLHLTPLTLYRAIHKVHSVMIEESIFEDDSVHVVPFHAIEASHDMEGSIAED